MPAEHRRPRPTTRHKREAPPARHRPLGGRPDPADEAWPAGHHRPDMAGRTRAADHRARSPSPPPEERRRGRPRNCAGIRFQRALYGASRCRRQWLRHRSPSGAKSPPAVTRRSRISVRAKASIRSAEGCARPPRAAHSRPRRSARLQYRQPAGPPQTSAALRRPARCRPGMRAGHPVLRDPYRRPIFRRTDGSGSSARRGAAGQLLEGLSLFESVCESVCVPSTLLAVELEAVEPPQFSRRPRLLRRWGYDEQDDEQVLARPNSLI